MNVHPLILTLLAALPSAGAASPTQATDLRVDCAHPALPSQRAVAEFAGVANFSQAYALRERLMLDVQRACKRGAGQVRLVREVQPADGGPTVAVVP